MACFTSGHRPREYPDSFRCRDCGRRVWLSTEVPPVVTLAQLMVLAAALGAASVLLGWW